MFSVITLTEMRGALSFMASQTRKKPLFLKRDLVRGKGGVI
jgi:hypothetical protein